MTASETMMEGYLEKQSLCVKKFRKRWIVLDINGVDASLRCYITDIRSQMTENIDLKAFSSLKTNNTDTFILVHYKKPHKNRFFKSYENSVLNSWMKVIAKVIKDNNMVRQAQIDGTIKKIYTNTICLEYEITNEYQHKVTKQQINCPNLLKLKSKDPMRCKIYCNVKEHYEYTQDNLDHLQQFRHHAIEYEDKPVCKYGDECKTYIRSENGTDQHRIDDKCHMFIYRHPPRTRQIKLAENIRSLVVNTDDWENYMLYHPTKQDKEKYHYNETDGYLRALLSEVITNGFRSDLCLSCSEADECKHNPMTSKHSILQIVDEKMNCLRHKLVNKPLNRAEMLALILYTGLSITIAYGIYVKITLYSGCDCNYDLCAAQRNGNYYKWKFFDHCLFSAIQTLSKKERGRYPVYSGLNGVKMNRKVVTNGYFVTYVSASWRKEVAHAFMKDEGLLIYILMRCIEIVLMSIVAMSHGLANFRMNVRSYLLDQREMIGIIFHAGF